MEFEWDENKNQSNIEKHSVDFNDAKEVFKDENRKTSPDLRKDYGEDRWITIGKFIDTIIVVVYTIVSFQQDMLRKKNVKHIIINNMETKIYWKNAIELLKKGQQISQDNVDFKNEQIPVKEVTFLNKNSIRVPDNLIFYDDENIDCSDIPEITEEDISSGKIQWITINEFPIDNEIRSWISKQNIKLNELLPYLLKNFYQTVKFAQKNAAL